MYYYDKIKNRTNISSNFMKLILSGVPASPGTAQGEVRVVKGTEDENIFKKGEVLVTRLTDPSMLSMMAKSAAIVTNIGGMTSHPAIVSREFGIPCIVATQKATQVLKDGMLVEVNGSTGEILLIEGEEK